MAGDTYLFFDFCGINLLFGSCFLFRKFLRLFYKVTCCYSLDIRIKMGRIKIGSRVSTEAWRTDRKEL